MVLIVVDAPIVEFRVRGRLHSNERSFPTIDLGLNIIAPVLYIVFTPCSSAPKVFFSYVPGHTLNRSRHPPRRIVGHSLQHACHIAARKSR